MKIFIYLATILLLLIDVYGSNLRLYKYINVHSYIIALIAITILVLLRIFADVQNKGLIYKLNGYIIFPLTLISSICLTLWDAYSPPNYVYSITKLQHTQIFLIAVFSGIVLFLSQSNKWFSDNLKPLIFSGVFVYLGIISIISLFPFEVLKKLSVEDNLIENLQFLVLIFAAILAFKTFYILYRKKIIIHAVIFIFISLVLFFVAGDEISWGQRIFNIKTPESIAQYNAQNEITVHNLSFFENFVNIGYIILGLYGASVWALLRLFPTLKTKNISLYIPPWPVSAYFYFGFLYNLFTRTHTGHTLGIWAESAELVLYTGITLTLFLLIIKNNGEIEV